MLLVMNTCAPRIEPSVCAHVPLMAARTSRLCQIQLDTHTDEPRDDGMRNSSVRAAVQQMVIAAHQLSGSFFSVPRQLRDSRL